MSRKRLAEAPDARVLTYDGFIGTPAFASPEQFAGAPVDVRSDIYSLGVTLWFLLTGHLPFGQDQIDSKALPIEQLKAPRVPSSLLALLRAMLATEPAARPSVRELAKKLEAIQTEGAAKRKPVLYLAIAASAIVLAAGTAFLVIAQPWIRHSPPNESVSEKSIAVLPFGNMSEEKENAFFADGIQDDILTGLAKVADLKVISRTSVMGYGPTSNRDLRAIGHALQVVYVVEGSVRRAGGWVRVTAQLIDARTNMQLWAEGYDRELEDVFAIQSEIAKKIADQLQAKLSPHEKAAIEEPPTKNLTAYELYVRAKALKSATTAISARTNDTLEAARLLEEATARDPEFFVAYCELASTHSYVYFTGLDHTPERLELASRAVKAALSLKPNAGEAHLTQAYFLYRCYLDYDRARSELAIAERTLANNAEVFELAGYIDRRQGRWSESARSFEKALELDPRNFVLLQQISFSYICLRRFEDMAAVLDRALTLTPQDIGMRVTRAWVELEWRADTRPLHETIERILLAQPAAKAELGATWFYLALCEKDAAAASRALSALPPQGIALDAITFTPAWCEGLAARARRDEESAHAAFTAARVGIEQKAREQPEYGPAQALLGLTEAALGHKEEALRAGRRAVALLPVTKDSIKGADLMKYLAGIYAWSGEKDLAIDQLRETLKVPGYLSYGQLRLNPMWYELHGDARFEELVASLAPKARRTN